MDGSGGLGIPEPCLPRRFDQIAGSGGNFVSEVEGKFDAVGLRVGGVRRQQRTGSKRRKRRRQRRRKEEKEDEKKEEKEEVVVLMRQQKVAIGPREVSGKKSAALKIESRDRLRVCREINSGSFFFPRAYCVRLRANEGHAHSYTG